MSAHKAEAVNFEVVSNDAIAVHIHCCGDPASEYRHTIYGVSAKTEAEIDAEVEAWLPKVEAMHGGRHRAEAHIRKKVGARK